MKTNVETVTPCIVQRFSSKRIPTDGLPLERLNSFSNEHLTRSPEGDFRPQNMDRPRNVVCSTSFQPTVVTQGLGSSIPQFDTLSCNGDSYRPGELHMQSDYKFVDGTGEPHSECLPELLAALERERLLRNQQCEYIHQLQMYYDALLKKYAIAEVTIDQLRVGSVLSQLGCSNEINSSHPDKPRHIDKSMRNDLQRCLSLSPMPVKQKSVSMGQISLPHSRYNHRQCISITLPSTDDRPFVESPASMFRNPGGKHHMHDTLNESPRARPNVDDVTVGFSAVAKSDLTYCDYKESHESSPRCEVDQNYALCASTRSNRFRSPEESVRMPPPISFRNFECRPFDHLDGPHEHMNLFDEPVQKDLLDQITTLQGRISQLLRLKDEGNALHESHFVEAYSQYVQLMDQLARANYRWNECPLRTGHALHTSPPCQPFSTGGSQSAHESHDTAQFSASTYYGSISNHPLGKFSTGHISKTSVDNEQRLRINQFRKQHFVERSVSCRAEPVRDSWTVSSSDCDSEHSSHQSSKESLLITHKYPLSPPSVKQNHTQASQKSLATLGGLHFQRVYNAAQVSSSACDVRRYEYKLRKYTPIGFHKYCVQQTHQSVV